MAVVYPGQGDPRRSIPLLWREPSDKTGLTLDAILDAAIAVADEHGMAALSMRAVGERLGRTAMALYTYVPGKAELLDLMYDKVLGELPDGYDLAAGWRAALMAWAEDARAFHLRHPWMLEVSQARPVLGPNEFRMLEALVAIVRSTGLAPSRAQAVVGVVMQFVRGTAAMVTEVRRAATVTGVSDEDWWYARSGVLTEVVPDFGERFPNATWLGAEEPPPVEDDPCASYLEREAMRNFRVGLRVLLDGVEAALGGQGVEEHRNENRR
ncbi:TetR/AcrR family transcriptional regulator C-terminal domain-containing protein [Saccharothrix violaceirubra]|uniref:AcrR family transcriptional regulator n=1 Tax=Saccharothrix violaceirubra TaxID=413306 RepID=A0A7W7T3P4_9PSEU|nr:TetR/AcrR family transcriptional regulator [Saccharothrix violaceirubra]MBB4965983.1 AcrR family transcriptional regulator [Saccharothrix violaceirubra]